MNEELADMLFVCERRRRRRALRAEVCVPLSWTRERVDTLFIDKRARKAAAPGANLASGASQTKLREQLTIKGPA
jgi:hypothetical protein